jgi:hypothetical protein
MDQVDVPIVSTGMINVSISSSIVRPRNCISSLTIIYVISGTIVQGTGMIEVDICSSIARRRAIRPAQLHYFLIITCHTWYYRTRNWYDRRWHLSSSARRRAVKPVHLHFFLYNTCHPWYCSTRYRYKFYTNGTNSILMVLAQIKWGCDEEMISFYLMASFSICQCQRNI